jgi:hypothetical protein
MGKRWLLGASQQKEFDRFLRRLADQLAKKIVAKVKFAFKECPYCEKPLGFGADTIRIRPRTHAHFSCFEEADKRDEAGMFANELAYPSTPLDFLIEAELAQEAAENGGKMAKVIPLRRAS